MLFLQQRLLFDILNRLSWRDLLRCSLVCKSLHRTVVGFPSLQYKIELAATGMSDNEHYLWSPREKLAKLRRYEKAWANFFPTKVVKSVVPLTEEAGWEWYGGLLATTLGDHEIKFVRPGSRIRNIPQQSWVLNFVLSTGTTHMDPYQDLIILTFYEEHRNYLHLLDIHTGETHPLARIPSIPLPAPMHSTYDIQTWGNKVAILIRWLDGNLPLSRIVVWDWHLGVPITIHESISECDETVGCYVDYITHTFLDENRLLLSCCDYINGNGFQNGRVVVVNLAHGSEAFLRSASFCVPLPAEGCTLADLVVARNCPLLPSGGDHAPFGASQDTAVIAIRCIYQLTILGLSENIVIFTPSDIFSSLCDKFGYVSDTSAHSIDWDLWGPENTRAIDDMDLTYFAIFGSRFACIQDNLVTVYDFNHRGALSNITLSLTNCMDEDGESTATSLATRFTSPSTISSKMLKGDLTTSLPYRVLSTGITDEKGTEIVISEDSIAIHNEEDEMFIVYTV